MTAGAATCGRISLFPLNTVLFPGSPLRLRIFEARYLDMISACLKQDSNFGVCLITDGTEAGAPATTVDVGTTAKIISWEQLEDGLLGIRVVGGSRFRMRERRVLHNNLIEVAVDYLDEMALAAIPDDFLELAAILKDLMKHTAPLYDGLSQSYADANWIGFQLADLLPLPLSSKQYLLELDDPLLRLQHLQAVIRAIQETDYGA